MINYRPAVLIKVYSMCVLRSTLCLCAKCLIYYLLSSVLMSRWLFQLVSLEESSLQALLLCVCLLYLCPCVWQRGRCQSFDCAKCENDKGSSLHWISFKLSVRRSVSQRHQQSRRQLISVNTRTRKTLRLGLSSHFNLGNIFLKQRYKRLRINSKKHYDQWLTYLLT